MRLGLPRRRILCRPAGTSPLVGGAVLLDGVDESITLASLFAGRVTSDKADPFSWGISASLPSTASGALIGAPTSELDCTAALDIVSGTIRAYVQHNATTVVYRRTPVVLTADTAFSVSATRGAGTYPEIYIDGVVAGANNGSSSRSPNDSTTVAIGKNGPTHRNGTFWAFWWTPVEMTATQVGELDALISALAYEDAQTYLAAISSESVLIPVLSTDDLTSGTGSVQDLFGNLNGAPVNTEPADLVAVPA